MRVYHNVAQYSEAYDYLKLGMPTRSNSKDHRTPRQAFETLGVRLRRVHRADTVARNRVLQTARYGVGLVEVEAAGWYEFDQDASMERVGFTIGDNHTVGCSPDRLVGEGLSEIKAPLPHTQVERTLSKSPQSRTILRSRSSPPSLTTCVT
jgi:hypothetical protein